MKSFFRLIGLLLLKILSIVIILIGFIAIICGGSNFNGLELIKGIRIGLITLIGVSIVIYLQSLIIKKMILGYKWIYFLVNVLIYALLVLTCLIIIYNQSINDSVSILGLSIIGIVFICSNIFFFIKYRNQNNINTKKQKGEETVQNTDHIRLISYLIRILKEILSIDNPQIQIVNSESVNLMNSLVQVDISDISSIIFLPKTGKGFQIKTPNIKRLAVYITKKLGKTVFEGEELRDIYNHVIENLQSNLSKTDYNTVQGKINEFVQSGGEVKIERI